MAKLDSVHLRGADMITGEAAGVPYVAIEPAGGARPDAPIVVAHHLLDAPRSERAFAAALPLDGLDAWRFYLGLPLSGSRLPAGGVEEIMRLGYEDAVRNLHGAINAQAADEYPAAIAVLRERFGLAGDAPLGLLGGSAGSSVALELITRGVPASAAVLVSAVPRLRALVAELEGFFGVTVPSSPEADAHYARMDYVARATALGGVPIRVVVGGDDGEGAVRTPCRELVAAVGGPADLVTIPGMGHALADEPGLDPAPQTPDAADVDAHAVDWFRTYL